ncbi:MAG: EAL domain-containing protein [Methylicorpusculum sp.]|nr:EAL domain-containing protein [Methylicorpusculum sp.]
MTHRSGKYFIGEVNRRLAPWIFFSLVLMSGLGITVTLWRHAEQQRIEHLRSAFESSADMATQTIRNRINNFSVVMRGVKGFFEGSDYISTEEFRAYIQALNVQTKLPGVQGIGLVTLVPHADKARHTAEIRKQNLPNYSIKPEGQRDIYAPISHIEPLTDENLKAHGFDTFTLPHARTAMERSRDTGDIAITSRITLVQDADKQGVFAFVMYLPIYKQGVKLDTQAELRAANAGWVDVPFRMNDFMAGLRGAIDPDIDFDIHDHSPDYDPTPLYHSDNISHHERTLSGSLQTSREIEFGGRQWALQLSTTPAFIERISPGNHVLLIAIAGIAVTLTLSLLTWLLSSGRESAQSRFQLLFKQAGDGILLISRDHRLIEANPAALRMLGYRRDELLQRRLPDIVATHEQSRLDLEVSQMMSGVTHLVEWMHVRKDGSEFAAEVCASQLDSQFYFAILRDLTERKNAEQRILRLTHLYQALSETNQAIVRMIDESELFPLVCRCAVDFGGMKMAWIGQLNEADQHIDPVACHGEDLDYLDKLTISSRGDLLLGCGIIGTALRENHPVIVNDYFNDAITRHWHESAKTFGWHSAAAFPIQRNDKPFAVFSVYHAQTGAFDKDAINLLKEMACDISFALDNFDRENQRQLTEKALFKSESHFRFVTESSQALIWVSGTNKKCTWFNKIWLDFTGRTMEQELGNGWMEGVHPDDIKHCMDLFLSHFERLEPFCMEYRLKHRDGEYRWIIDNGAPYFDDQGIFQGYIGSCLDITERKAAEQALAENEAKMSAVLENVSAYIYIKDEAGRYQYVNRNCLTLWNKTMDEVIGATDEKLFDAQSAAQILKNDRCVLVDGKAVQREEANIVTSTGKVASYWAVKIPLMRENGTIYGLCGISTDISELKRLEMSLLENEKLLSESQRIAQIGSWRIALPSHNVTWSDETYRIFQTTQDRFEQTLEAFTQRIHPQDREVLQAWLKDLVENGTADSHLFKILLSESNERILEMHGELKCDANGMPIAINGTVQDITERLQAEQQLRLNAQVFEFSREGIIITDAQNKIVAINPAYSEISGYSFQEALGKNPRLVSSGKQDKAFYKDMWQQILNQGHWQGEVINRRKNGSLYPQRLSISVIRDQSGRISHHIGILNDLSEHKAAEERIQFLSNFDPLTHLPNRDLLRDRTQLALAAAQRADSSFALMYLDVDRFKIVNDSMGPSIGDQLLKELANRLIEHLHPDDTVCRQGGDEFIFLLPNTDAEGAAHVAQKMLELIAQPFTLEGQRMTLTASIGIAQYPQDGNELEQLAQSADAALFRAKQNGRNNFQFFTRQLHQQAHEMLQVENELRQALERNELILYYQPQIDAKTSKIIGVEALIRWQHPQKGMVPPGRFIPIAEESGLIVDIGDWVLHTAIQQNVTWQNEGLNIVPVAVNLSVAQFRQDRLYRMIAQYLREYKLDPALLELEMTEGIAMENTEQTISTLNQLHALGVKLAIDDFGTGYSSLSYLKRFQIDKLKIDQSFVRDLGRDTEDAAIVTAIIGMAKGLGFKTIAEGVETQDQLDFLREKQCDEIQGYFFSKPVPPEKFAELLRKGSI